mgnify:CR=1 FL=1
MQMNKHSRIQPMATTVVYSPAVTDGETNSSGSPKLYEVSRILSDFANYENGERCAGIECLLTNGTVRRFRWDRLVNLNTAS